VPACSEGWLRGAAGAGREARGYAVGAVDYLCKPFDPAVLRAKVGALVAAFRRGQEVALRALRQREAELTDFLENAAGGMHWVAGDGTILWANQAELDLLGYTREEYIGHPIAEFHADSAVIEDILHRLANRDTLHNYEARLRCKDGSIRHVLISSNVLWEGERFVHTRCLTRDITQRVQAQEAQQFLMEAGELLASSLDYGVTLERLARLTVPRLADWCAVDVLDAAGAIRRVAVVHVDPAKVELAYELERRYPPDPTAAVGLPKVLRTGEPEFFPTIPDALLVKSARDEEHLRLARELGLLSAMVVPLVSRGRVLGALSLVTAESGRLYTADDLAFAQDLARRAAVAVDNALLYQAAQEEIAERRRVEQAARFQADLLGIVEQAVIATDLEGRITYWNRFAETLYGWTAEEVRGRSILEVTPSEEALEHAAEILARLRTGASWAGEFRVKRRDGTVFPAWVVDAPIRDEQGELVGVVGVSTDISQLKRLEASLRERMDALQEADRRKDAFLAMIGHELRNPLAAVSNALHVIGAAPPGSATFTRAREAAVRQVLHQTRIVEDLLDVSRIALGKVELRRERLDLLSVMCDIVEDQRASLEGAGLQVTVRLPDQAVPVMGDRTRLTQVLENLLENARKFTPTGGQVTVTVTADADAGQASLRVRDTGVGIDGDTLAHLFEPFTQADRSLDRSPGGLGLGLSLVKGLVELHGGRVTARSEGPGEGTEFVITLPIAAEPAALQEAPVFSRRASRTLRILVVEDNVDAAETLRDLLELSGYAVELAHTGPAGLEKALAFRPEVILCDIGLPGINGYEVAAALRRQPETAGLHLIAVTGYGTAADQERSQEAGFNRHLTKPLDPAELQQVLAEAAGSQEEVRVR
jgi:PAS domain S-box-containing protein